MKTLLTILRNQFWISLQQCWPEQNFTLQQVEITSSQFAHYQCNSAMKLAKRLKLAPKNIAQQLVAVLPNSFADLEIERYEIAEPGFINIFLSSTTIAKQVHTLLLKPNLGIIQADPPQKLVIDFSSPNTAKEMHVGHLRSTIIGDSLARLFEFLGYDVLRLNHLGDWGTAFGMLIAHLQETKPTVLSGETSTDLTHLMTWYRESKQRFDSDPSFKVRAHQQVVALQSGEHLALEAWEIICRISRNAYQEIYDLLDIQLIERGESFYNPYLAEVVADTEKKGLIQLSDGAKCVFPQGFVNREGEPLPFMLQKSDGGYNYATTDLASIRHRIQVEKAQRIIYVTDAGQSLHFQMLFKVAEMAGYLDPTKVQCDHVAFGLVLGPGGKKFKTRAGDTEKLIDLIQAAINHAKEILHKRDFSLAEEILQQTATVLGINAIKYADLCTNRISDYVFSYEKMLRFEGNTAAFLMYAYVRIASIKRKINCDVSKLIAKELISLEHASEITLGLHLAQFPEILLQIAGDLLPHRLADYLFSLAEKFNAFFRDCRVEGSPKQSSRLLLCEAAALILKQGMTILGLKTLEKM